MNKRPHRDDQAFMSSVSQAILAKPVGMSRALIWIIFLLIAFLIFWANNTELDKLVRADGKVVPSSQIQVVQNLEGGIVKDIYVKTGDVITKNAPLIKLDSTQYDSSATENAIRLLQINAKAQRLRAEATGQSLSMNHAPAGPEDNRTIYVREFELYETRQQQQISQDIVLKEQILQKQSELSSTKSQIEQLQTTLNLINREVALMSPLVKKGVASEIDLLKLKREQNEIQSQKNNLKNSIPMLNSQIKEFKAKRQEAREQFANAAKEELNEILAEKAQIESSNLAINDRMVRTLIKSPVEGTIKQLFVNTIGGVIQPGRDILEIVPLNDTLVLEAKIKPADIGFLYPGLKTKIKFTAYDFSIYGGLDGQVASISADTITDEEGQSFYLAKITTNAKYLQRHNEKLFLMPGMTASVDIIVGKQTILDYILKPILKTKETALRES